MRGKSVLVVVLMTHTTILQARPVVTFGAGVAASCGTWLDQRSKDQYYGMANWALGFISGAAVYGDLGDPLGSTDVDGVAYWLDNYCRNYPSGQFVAAVRAFISTRQR